MLKCWICNINFANTGEHKFKASDIKRTYGKKIDAYYINDENIVEIKSFKDKSLKFPKIIYKDCNESKTRAHDDAYDLFTKFIDQNFKTIFDEKCLDFEKIYGNRWKIEKKNLFRYFAKHAGCKIQTSDYPQNLNDLSSFINNEEEIPNFKLSFELKVMIKYLHEYYNKTTSYVHLFNGNTLYFGENSSDLNFGGWTTYNWITTYWVYSKNTLAEKIDFENQKENLLIREVDDYKESFYKYDKEKLITYIEYGNSLNSFDKRLNYFKNMIMSKS